MWKSNDFEESKVHLICVWTVDRCIYQVTEQVHYSFVWVGLPTDILYINKFVTTQFSLVINIFIARQNHAGIQWNFRGNIWNDWVCTDIIIFLTQNVHKNTIFSTFQCWPWHAWRSRNKIAPLLFSALRKKIDEK